MKNLRRMAGIAGVALAATGASLATSAAVNVPGLNSIAGASSPSNCQSRGCDLFAFGPANGYFFTTPGNVIIFMQCWTNASVYDGTNRWFKISTIYGSGTAWVSANQVTHQSIVGHC